MATQAQIDANRLNAQHSTGPTSAEGKNTSRMNAFKTGLFAFTPVLPDEDPDEWSSFRNGFHISLAPTGSSQKFVVEMAAQAAWCLMVRVANIERKVAKKLGGIATLVCGSSGKMTQILRYQMQQKRLMCDFLAELRRLKKEQGSPPVAANNPAPAAKPPVVSPIPVAVQPDPKSTETSPGDAQAAEAAGKSPDQLAFRELVREESLKFYREQNLANTDLSSKEIADKMRKHLIEIGIIADSPQAEAH